MIGRHGTDCPKVTHIGGGYLHADDDDGPYAVDGIWYCGRCHVWIGIVEPIEKRPPQRTEFQRYVDDEFKMTDTDRIKQIIESQDFDARRRIHVVAQILRDLIADKEQGWENELAFTLVMAERAEAAMSNFQGFATDE